MITLTISIHTHKHKHNSTMETQSALPSKTKPIKDYHSNVDTSRPFSSVKEAVAVFGERLLAGEIYSYPSKPYIYTTAYYTPSSSPNPRNPYKEEQDQEQEDQCDHHEELLDTFKKLQAELEETKEELKQLKERESETEIAIASLNAELHKNKSKLAEAEAEAAAANKKAIVAAAARDQKGVDELVREEERRRELMRSMDSNQTVAHILSLGEEESIVNGYFGGYNTRKERVKTMKKKPIVPLVGDLLFFKKKRSSTTATTTNTPKLQNSLFASPDKIWQ